MHIHIKNIYGYRDMLEFKARPFIEAVYLLGQLRIVLERSREMKVGSGVDVSKSMDSIIPHLEALGLNHTIMAANRVTSLLSKDGAVYGAALLQLIDMQSRMCDEMENKHFLLMTTAEASLYSLDSPPFGEMVRVQFPMIGFDLAEAAKCLALGRSTACVFHLMRALESVLKAVARCLEVKEPASSNWGQWLGVIRKEIKENRPGNWEEKVFFQDVYSRLDAIKDANRNTTMHVECTYASYEAQNIYDLTKGFVQKVANRMNEDGLPKA